LGKRSVFKGKEALMPRNVVLVFGGLTGNSHGAELFRHACLEVGITPNVQILAGHSSYTEYHRSTALHWVRGGLEAMREELRRGDIAKVAIVSYSTGVLPGFSAAHLALRHLDPSKVLFLPIAPCLGLASSWDEFKLGAVATVTHGVPLVGLLYAAHQLVTATGEQARSRRHRAALAALSSLAWALFGKKIAQQFRLPNDLTPERVPFVVSPDFNLYGLVTLFYVKRVVRLLERTPGFAEMPKVVICGSDDQTVDIRLIHKFTRRYRKHGARLHLIPGKDHTLIFDPYVVGFAVAALEDFFSREEVRSGSKQVLLG
jgi:pimeloyl-ACP methyl ester carboxylesterase